MVSRHIPVRFPCRHGYYRSHLGVGGLDGMNKRGAKWCRGGEYRYLREVDPARVAIMSDNDTARYRIYVEEVDDE